MDYEACRDVNIFALDLEPRNGDPDEVVVAKCLLRLDQELDGIADEMSYREIDRANIAYEGRHSAIQVLEKHGELRYRQ